MCPGRWWVETDPPVLSGTSQLHWLSRLWPSLSEAQMGSLLVMVSVSVPVPACRMCCVLHLKAF